MPEMVTCPMCQRSVPADVVHTCPGGPVHVGHWTVTTPDTKETFPRGPSNEQTLLAELGQVKAERDKLQVFKTWVHAYLDTHGVPHHPPGTHGAEGCRIGDRMDWLMTKLANAEQAADHIAAEDRAERDALRAQLAEVQEDLEDEQDSGDSAYAADTKRIYEIRELTADRDALAVTAERYRLALLRIGQHSFQSVTDGHRCRRIVVDALLCTVEELEGME